MMFNLNKTQEPDKLEGYWITGKTQSKLIMPLRGKRLLEVEENTLEETKKVILSTKLVNQGEFSTHIQKPRGSVYWTLDQPI